MVLGGHGDTMVPLISYTSVSWDPDHAAHAAGKLNASWSDRGGGAEIVNTSRPVRPTTLRRQRRSRCVSRSCSIRSAFFPAPRGSRASTGCLASLGVPCKLGRGGLEKINEWSLPRGAAMPWRRARTPSASDGAGKAL